MNEEFGEVDGCGLVLEVVGKRDGFPDSCKHFADEEETARSVIEGSEISLRLIDQLRDPAEDADLFLRHRAWTYLFLAKGHFRLGNREEGYTAPLKR